MEILQWKYLYGSFARGIALFTKIRNVAFPSSH